MAAIFRELHRSLDASLGIGRNLGITGETGTGKELADRAAILRPNMKVIYLSGFSEYGVAFENFEQVRDFFIQKPFSM